MNNKIIEILVKAKDEASRTLANVGGKLDETTGSANRQSGAIQKLRDNWVGVAAVAASSGVAFRGLTGFMQENVDAAVRLQSALLGLNSIARAFGQDAKSAERAARDLANDGLMTVTDGATGLKNLLASGFNLDQAVNLMKRFKDSAAFGRQSALSFGQAVSSATEGIKNGNSILVDNAGVTKNLSIILEEAGFSAQDLMRATQDAGVRQAIYNGILKETTPMLGDASRLSDSFAGNQARLSAQSEVLRQRLGESLQPALTKLLETVTPLIVRFAEFTDKHPTLVSNVILLVTALTGMTFVLGSLGLAVVALGPIFAAFGAASTLAIGSTGLAFRGLATIVATPLIMPAIAVAAALFAIAQVKNAYTELQNERSKTESAINSLNKQYDVALQKGKLTLDQIYKIQNSPGYLGNKTVYKQGNTYVPGFSKGVENFGGGMAYVHGGEVLMNLPKGTDVVPKNEVSGKFGNTINQTNHIYNQVDLALANTELGWRLANA